MWHNVLNTVVLMSDIHCGLTTDCHIEAGRRQYEAICEFHFNIVWYTDQWCNYGEGGGGVSA